MRILFFGDINGKIGREAIKKELPGLQKKYQPNLTLANAENLAHGIGLTEKTIIEMREAGIDYFTSGNHVFDKPEAEQFLAVPGCPVIRPANYPTKKPGVGSRLVQKDEYSVLLINLMGRVFIDEEFANPFLALDKILREQKNEKLAAILVDFHAEATSEKKAMGFYAQDRVSAVLGTHTHVATADETILGQGTAYLTDVGMVGAEDSVIGVEKKTVINSFLKDENIEVDIPLTGTAIINGVLLEIDEKTRQTRTIERILVKTKI